MEIYTWINENQVALSKGLWVTFGTGFLSFKKYLQSLHYKKLKTVASLFFPCSRCLSLFSLFSVNFGLIAHIITLVWPSFSKTAVIFIDHVFINSAIYLQQTLWHAPEFAHVGRKLLFRTFSDHCRHTMEIYTWIYENQVALSKGLWVSKVHTIKT